MPNPFHYRARIDRLWRNTAGHNPSHVRLRALDAVFRELFAPNDRARRNHQLYLATDPFDVARHLLRDLYDRAEPTVSASEGSICLPLPVGEGPFTLAGEETLEEDDDPW